MSRENRIKQKLSVLNPEILGVENESHKHSVPPNSETHFKVLIVSRQFAGKMRIDRQRMINDLMAEEFKSGLHALTQKNLTPEEWEIQKDSLNFVSPACLGGSRFERA